MKIQGVVGNAFGHSGGGALVRFDEADSRQLVDATSGLAKALVVAGAVGLGVYLVSRAFSRESLGCVNPGKKRIVQNLGDMGYSDHEFPSQPIIPVVNVCTQSRQFTGVIYEPESLLEIVCEDNNLSIPLDRVRWIHGDYRFRGYPDYQGFRMGLIDGSTYKNVDIKSELKFLSVAGLQGVRFPNPKDAKENDTRYTLIVGTLIERVQQLRCNLLDAMKTVAKPAVEVIGEEVFNQYFLVK